MANANANLTICALQPQLRPDDQSPQEAIQDAITLMHQAHTQAAVCGTHIHLFCLPELSPIGYTEDTFQHYLPTTRANQRLYEELEERMAQTARDLMVHICFGTVGWHPKPNHPDKYDLTIRQVVVDTSGHVVAKYDKVYPCDFGDCAETRFFVASPSRQLVSFEVEGDNGAVFRVGLIICADQRVPGLARQLVGDPTHAVDVLLQPAAFYRDVSFATWKSFRETRAVENSVYFVGVNYAGDKYGDTTSVPPWVDDNPDNPHSKPTSLQCQEGWLLCTMSRQVLQQVRTTFPFYQILQQEFKCLQESHHDQ